MEKTYTKEVLGWIKWCKNISFGKKMHQGALPNKCRPYLVLKHSSLSYATPQTLVYGVSKSLFLNISNQALCCQHI